MRPLKVLYIDDEPDLCEIFSMMFSSDDVKVTTFVNPFDAVAALETFKPDVIFTDYRIPLLNGVDIARKIAPGIPKYLITGELDVKPDVEFDRILAKPIEFSLIEKILADLKRSCS